MFATVHALPGKHAIEPPQLLIFHLISPDTRYASSTQSLNEGHTRMGIKFKKALRGSQDHFLTL